MSEYNKIKKRSVFIIITGYTLLILGSVFLIKTETTNTFKKKSINVIYTSYENGICYFKTDCLNIKNDNGCRNYYTTENAYNFKCSYLNVVLGYDNSSMMLCTINHFEKGFNYPELGEVWYNSTYSKFYDIVNVGDTLNVWYDENKGKCLLNFDKSGYVAGIIIVVLGLTVVFMNCGTIRKNRVSIQDESYNKKTTNFINVNMV